MIEIEENNKLIAKFMNFPQGKCIRRRYDKSWDFLMPVISCIWAMDEYRKFVNETSGQFENKIEIDGNIDHTYPTVIDFIKWYNKQK